MPSTDVPPFEFLWIVKESAYGTAMVSPVAGTDSIYIRLSGPNRFTMREVRTKHNIDFGGGFATPGYAITDQRPCAGKLSLELTYAQAKMLLDWSTTRINAGQTTPWTTTELPGDLASCTVYHGSAYFDTGAIKRSKYPGVKVHGFKIASAPGFTMLDLDLVAQKKVANVVDGGSDPDATAFPAPADTAFPVDFVRFLDTYNGFKVGGSAVVNLEGVDLAITNKFGVTYLNTPFLQYQRLRGRSSTCSAKVLYTATPNWRADLEALATRAIECNWTNGVNTIKLDYRGQNLLDTLADDLKPGDLYRQTVTWENQYDTTNGTPSFTFT